MARVGGWLGAFTALDTRSQATGRDCERPITAGAPNGNVSLSMVSGGDLAFHRARQFVQA